MSIFYRLAGAGSRVLSLTHVTLGRHCLERLAVASLALGFLTAGVTWRAEGTSGRHLS